MFIGMGTKLKANKAREKKTLVEQPVNLAEIHRNYSDSLAFTLLMNDTSLWTMILRRVGAYCFRVALVVMVHAAN